MDRGDGRAYPLLTKLGLAVLTCNSLVAAYRSWGDPGSLVFLALAYAALLLLLHFLRSFERAAAAPADRGRAKAAVWALSTVLTAMFVYAYASTVAPVMPLVIGALIFLCLCESEWAGMSLGGGRYAELVKMGLSVVACNTALAHHHHHHHDARGGDGSLAFVFIAFAGFVTRACLFLLRFHGRARQAEQ